MRDMLLNKDVKKYIKDINSYLICDCATRNRFISDLKSDIEEYIESNSVTAFESVYNHFGEPRDIAKGFLENADTKKIKRKMDIAKVVVTAVIIALVMWGIGITAAWIDFHQSHTGYDETVITDAAIQSVGFIELGEFL